MNFTFSAPQRIVFGVGVAQQLPSLVAELGRRPFVVTGAHRDRVASALGELADAPSGQISGEPDIETIRSLAAQLRDSGADVVVAIGGGSVIDAAKAVAMLVGNNSDVLDHLEIVGRGLPITKASLPVIAVPTTAGTGSEVTANAVVLSPADGLKASLRAASMIPRIALVDPQLTVSAPASVTAHAGVDAITQCLEPYVSHLSTPITDALALDALGRAGALRRAVADPTDLDARADMSLISLYGGLCLANAKLGAVHGFAGPLGGMIDAAHGALCGALLAPVIAANLAALTDRDPKNPAVDRYRRAAVAVTGNLDANADDLVAWVRETVALAQVPGLGALGLAPDRYDEAAQKAASASSMKGNPITLTHEELRQILAAAA